ncbi:cytochrome P450- family 96- subfamily A-polypeptide 5 [Striga hermonthica]|uniref:Cytochrome P450- family 96- subfamily A-polypeptide 5 n=1 Tax=Striga hermonthica TaxID=68872 RepID=A0A9N7NUX3_STRHE|nr:cytochrome P450- family 96- subfamily A-polypeptide 5 [Striga hermonthica]
MAAYDYYQLLFIPLFTLLFLIYLFTTKNPKKSSIPTNWPIIGMLPFLFQNAHRVHEALNDVLIESGGTFEFKGPIFTNMDTIIITCDPANIDHIFVKKFSNYPKGTEFQKIFDILGDGFFRADFGLWELHRKTTLYLMRENFYSSLQKSVWEKVRTGLYPILDRFSQMGSDLDMQDVLGRFSFDVICRLLLSHDPCSLSLDMPNVPCERALNDVMGPLLSRYTVPEFAWKLQKWLNIGPERRVFEACRALDDFIYPHVFSHEENENVMFASFKKAYEDNNKNNEISRREMKDFLRDSFLNLLVAGRDSLATGLTWFFYLLSGNPHIEARVREEIEQVVLTKRGGVAAGLNKWRYFELDECDEMIYLHAVLSETMRLYPPIPMQQKVPTEPDILPGRKCRVDRDKKVVISFYSTGRMESVWGKDCLEFRPERWLEPGGRGIKQEPPSKFPIFNLGPRTCVGKKMAFIEMKMVAAFVVHHFNVRVVEDHPVLPRPAIILKAEHGLKVRLTRKQSPAALEAGGPLSVAPSGVSSRVCRLLLEGERVYDTLLYRPLSDLFWAVDGHAPHASSCWLLPLGRCIVSVHEWDSPVGPLAADLVGPFVAGLVDPLAVGRVGPLADGSSFE